MAFSLNGNTFTPQSPFDHATSMLTQMNSLLQSQSLPTLSPNNGNALWWTLLAQGGFATQIDQALIQASNSFNPAAADDSQILNLLPIAGTKLLPATNSTMIISFTASGAVTIPSNTLVPYGTYNFITSSGLYIPPSGTGDIYCSLDTTGPISCPVGSINLTGISGVTGLSKVTNKYPAIIGQNSETPSQARNRIINGKTIGVGIDGAIYGLRQLNGISQANIIANLASSGYLPVSGLVNGIPPRTAYIVVNGYNPLIAQVYLSYMTMLTSGVGLAPAQIQRYTTLSGQQIPVAFDYAEQQLIYCQVFIDSKQTIQNGYNTVLSNIISNLNGSFNIGQRVSSEIIANQLQSFNSATVLGALVSTTNGNYGQYADPSVLSIPYFSPSGISVVMV